MAEALGSDLSRDERGGVGLRSGAGDRGVVPLEHLGRRGASRRRSTARCGRGSTAAVRAANTPWGPGLGLDAFSGEPDPTPGSVTFELLRGDGTPRGGAQNDRSRPEARSGGRPEVLPRDGELDRGLRPDHGDGPRLAGSVVFGDPRPQPLRRRAPSRPRRRRAMSSSVSGLERDLLHGSRRPQPRQPQRPVTLELFDSSGFGSVRRSRTLGRAVACRDCSPSSSPARGRKPRVRDVKLTSDQPVASFALLARRADGALAAVPPQAVP